MNVGLLVKKRGNYKLQERLSGSDAIEDTTNNEIIHHQRALINAGFHVHIIHWSPDLIRDLKNSEVDLVFNVSSLAEAALLEELEIPFVGSGTNGIVLARNKALAKSIWLQNNIPTSEFVVLHNMDECEEFIENPVVPYPLFIKPVAGRGSAGISAESRIESKDKLLEQVERLLTTIRQPVIIEQFLVGREITIGLIGNGESLRTLSPMEVKFNGNIGFLTFRTKEEDSDKFICPADLSEKENKLIKQYAKKAFSALGLRDYGRIDTKLTDDGFRLLEANSFAGLTTTPSEKPHSYIGVMARAVGMGGTELLGDIVEAALERIEN